MIDAELAGLLERSITGGIFIFLYWRERQKVSTVQDARIADLHTWLQIIANIENGHILPTPDEP